MSKEALKTVYQLLESIAKPLSGFQNHVMSPKDFVLGGQCHDSYIRGKSRGIESCNSREQASRGCDMGENCFAPGLRRCCNRRDRSFSRDSITDPSVDRSGHATDLDPAV